MEVQSIHSPLKLAKGSDDVSCEWITYSLGRCCRIIWKSLEIFFPEVIQVLRNNQLDVLRHVDFLTQEVKRVTEHESAPDNNEFSASSSFLERRYFVTNYENIFLFFHLSLVA